MGTYVTDSGFKGRSVSDVISTLNAGLISLFGANTDTDPLQPNGMFIGLHAAMIAEGWDALSEIYSSVDPNAASGLALDRIVEIYGLSRIAAAASTVPAILYTDTTNLGCTIPSGSEARRVRGALVFSLSSALTIAAASCRRVSVSNRSRASASSAFRGRMASASAGDFRTLGRPMTAPHRFGTTVQSSRHFGLMATCRPTTADSATIAPTAGKSGGHCMRSAMSSIHGRSAAGNSAGSNAATGGRVSGSGAGSGQSAAAAGAGAPSAGVAAGAREARTRRARRARSRTRTARSRGTRR